MAILNFPNNPSNGDTYIENNVTYTYIGTSPNGFWQADNGNALEDIYVNRSGDTITGDVTITTLSGTGTRSLGVDSAGKLQVVTSSGGGAASPYVDESGDTMTGDLLFNAKAQIKADSGKATFGGTGTPREQVELTASGDVALELNSSGAKFAQLKLKTAGDLEIIGADGDIKFINGNADGPTGTEKVRIHDDGNVSIGTPTANEAQLTLGQGTGTANEAIAITGGNTVAGKGIRIGMDSNQDAYISQRDDKSILLYTNLLKRFTVDNVGRVMMNVDQPSTAGAAGLTVAEPGDINTGIQIRTSTTGQGSIQFGDSNSGTDAYKGYITYDHANDDLVVGTNATEALVIGSDGRIAINQTGWSSTAGIELNQEATAMHGIQINSSTSDKASIGFYAGSSVWGIGTDSNNADYMNLFYDAATRWSMDGNGNISNYVSNVLNTYHTNVTLWSGSDNGTINIGFRNNTTGPGANSGLDLLYDDVDLKLLNHEDGGIFFGHNGSLHSGFDSEGRWLIGATGFNFNQALIPGSNAAVIVKGNASSTSDGRILLANDGAIGSGLGHSTALGTITFGDNTGSEFGRITCETGPSPDPTGTDYPGELRFFTNSGSNATGATVKMTLDKEGKLGLNSTQPKSDLHIYRTDTPTIRFTNNHSNNGADDGTRMGLRNNDDWEIRNKESGGYIYFSPGDRESICLEPTGLQTIYSDNGNFSLEVSTARASGSSTALFNGYHSGTSTSARGTNVVKITSDGNITNVNNSYGALSDIKIKTNIVDAQSQWNDVKEVRLVNYEYKDSVAYGEGSRLGVIAQEIELISPGLVETTDDLITQQVPQWDSEGNPIVDTDGNQLSETVTQKTGSQTKSVKYSVLFTKALGALQEAMERIEQLEDEVNTLKAANQ